MGQGDEGKMDENAYEEWKRYLNPEELRPTLIQAALFITAFEILKNVIIDRIKDFFTHGYDENGPIMSEEYSSEVLKKDKSPVQASLKWLFENKAITTEDIDLFVKIKDHRNFLAHELSKLLSSGFPDVFVECFGDLIYLLKKIEMWWIINVEIPTSDDFDNFDEIDENEILPGSIINMKLLIDISLGTDEVAYSYLQELIKLSNTSDASKN